MDQFVEDAWATVEGNAELIGPHDPVAGFNAERLRLLLRKVYDRVMAEQRRTAILLDAVRIHSN